MIKIFLNFFLSIFFIIFLACFFSSKSYAAEGSYPTKRSLGKALQEEEEKKEEYDDDDDDEGYITPDDSSSRSRDLSHLNVTPQSLKKDRDSSLHHFSEEELSLYEVFYCKEEGFLFNHQTDGMKTILKYQVIYFLETPSSSSSYSSAAQGRLFAISNYLAEDEGYQHSSFDEFIPVRCLMAGEMYISYASSLIRINDDSGHYKPETSSSQTIRRLNLVAQKLRSLNVPSSYNIEITQERW